MKMRRTGKIFLLIALLASGLSLTSCYIPPDEISNTGYTNSGDNLPWQTIAPTATATPTPVVTAVPYTPTDAPYPQYNQGGNYGQQSYPTQAAAPTINWNDSWGTIPTQVPTTAPDQYTQYYGQTAAPEQTTIQVATPVPTGAPTIAVVTPPPTKTPKPVVTPTPAPSSLQSGSSGAEVKKLQQRLKDLGYYKGSVDGDFGAGTEKAVKAFQKANGLTADGKAGSKTLSILNSSNAIPYSSTVKPTAKKTASPTKKATATPKKTAPPTPSPTKTPRPTATPNLAKARYLREGYSGKDVTQLQQRLIQLGWLDGKADGNYGGATVSAVKAFQKKVGLWNDGVAGPETQAALYASTAPKSSTPAASSGETLRTGANGDAVRALQKRLKALGYYSGSIDGDYGTGTVAAVTAFQTVNGLTADGVAGTATLNAIYSDQAIKSNGSNAGSSSSGGHSSQQASAATARPTAKTTAKPTEAVIASTGYITLRQGDKSDAVTKLQNKLKSLGIYEGTVDGSYGSGTYNAVRDFQTLNHLTSDGVAGPATQRLLYGTRSSQTYSTLRPGDEGSGVANLQYTLYELGFYDGRRDGLYGDTTSDAVRAFQIANRLKPVDGIAGNKTLQRMYSADAVSATAAKDEYKTMRPGDKGENVVELQDELKKLGYLDTITGAYDKATERAVRAFQEKNMITADGVAGAVTQILLYENTPLRAN